MRADAEANRRELISVATRMIAAQGAGVSLRSIAESAGVGIGTLYRHFASREELFAGIVRSMLGEVCRAGTAFRESPLATAEKWLAYGRSLAALELGALATALSDAPRPDDLEELLARREEALADIDEVLSAVRTAGLVNEQVTPIRFLIGIIQITRPLPDDAPSEFAGEADWLLQTFLHGLR